MYSTRKRKRNEHYGFHLFIFLELAEVEDKISSLAVQTTLLAVVQHVIRVLLALAV